jgi:hypothetical protein
MTTPRTLRLNIVPMLAYSFPLLSVFWTMLIFTGLAIAFFFIIWCLVDNFRRKDHHGVAKFGWTIFILFAPVLGALVYILARPADPMYGSAAVMYEPYRDGTT